MKNFKKSFALVAFLVAFIFVSSCSKDEVATPKDVTDVAIANTQFSTLVSALTKAELVATLKGTGPFTVFAPDNAAFTKAGIDLAKETKTSLTPILLYHVLEV